MSIPSSPGDVDSQASVISLSPTSLVAPSPEPNVTVKTPSAPPRQTRKRDFAEVEAISSEASNPPTRPMGENADQTLPEPESPGDRDAYHTSATGVVCEESTPVSPDCCQTPAGGFGKENKPMTPGDESAYLTPARPTRKPKPSSETSSTFLVRLKKNIYDNSPSPATDENVSTPGIGSSNDDAFCTPSRPQPTLVETPDHPFKRMNAAFFTPEKETNPYETPPRRTAATMAVNEIQP